MPDFLILISVISIFIVLYIIFRIKLNGNKYKKDFKEFIQGKVKLTPIELYENLENKNNHNEDLFVSVIDCIYSQLDEDFEGFLRLDDNFKTNLSFIFKYDECLSIDLLEEIENRFKIKFTNSEVGKISTVHDIILVVSDKL